MHAILVLIVIEVIIITPLDYECSLSSNETPTEVYTDWRIISEAVVLHIAIGRALQCVTNLASNFWGRRGPVCP